MGGGCGNAESSGGLVCCTRDHCAPGSLIGGPGPPERRARPGSLLGGACVTSSRCPPSPPALTVADGYTEGRTRRLTRGAGPGGPRVGDSGQLCPASCGSPMSAACFWVTGPLGGSGGRTASVRRCAGGAGGSGGPRRRRREAGEERPGVRGAAQTPSLARVGRDEAPPWAGAVPVAAGVPRRCWRVSCGPEPWFASDAGREQSRDRPGLFLAPLLRVFIWTTSHTEPGFTSSLMRATSTEAHQGFRQLRVDTVVCVSASFTFRHVQARLFCFVFLAYSH